MLGVTLFWIWTESKVINDTLGHDMGDQLLRGVAERLKHAACAKATSWRSLGGDEVPLMLLDVQHPSEK